MYRLLYPLKYLSLRDEGGKRLVFEDLLPVVGLSLLLALPFIFVDANYFGVGGFLERFGSFSSVLTGFYIAALLGIATFSSAVGSLDELIEVGPVYKLEQQHVDDPALKLEPLSRREYVCSMFGYLAFMSLGLSVGSIATIILATPIARLARLSSGSFAPILQYWLPAVIIIFISLIVAHMVVTTCYGLYYLIDRLYATKPTIISLADNDGIPKD